MAALSPPGPAAWLLGPAPPRLTIPSVGCLPPAFWPPCSPEGSRCRRGAMPGRQGRMSGSPLARNSSRRTHSSLTACPGPRLAGHGRWQGGDAPSARAASLASSAAPADLGPVPSWPRPSTPTLIPTRISTLAPTPATRVPLPARVTLFALVMPPEGGVERPRRKVRVARLFHAARPRSWRTCGPRRLRRHSQACPGYHAEWFGMSTTRAG
jgi:hypothetical protein